MNRNRRSSCKTNTYDCFKPWQSVRKDTPLKNIKHRNIHRVVFAENCNHIRRFFTSPAPKTNNSLHSLFIKNVNRQIPKHFDFQPPKATDKLTKDNHNINIKQNHTTNKNRPSSEASDTKNKNIPLSEASETKNKTFPNQSVKNVIEKFNQLSNPEGSTSRAQNTSVTIKIRKPLYSESQELPTTSQDLPDYSQSQSRNMFFNDFLEIFKRPDSDDDDIEIIEKNTDDAQEKDLIFAELISAQTQTSPVPSKTNILINVYNERTPRILTTNATQNSSDDEENDHNIEIQILPNNFEDELYPGRYVSIDRDEIRNCIKKFDENLKKNGVEIRHEFNEKKIFTKIRSKYPLLPDTETKCPPKAKSVHF